MEERMFRHCVMLRFKSGITEDQKNRAYEGIRSLPDHIDEVVSYSVGFNAGSRSDNYDLVVVGDFVSEADYETYAGHAKHQEVIADLIAPIIDSRTAVQYVLEGQ